MKFLRLRILVLFFALGWSLPPGQAFADSQQQIRHALTGYQFQFPRDLYAHNDYRIEWWYLTGELEGDDGNQYGYHTVFIRVSLQSLKALQARKPSGSQWENDHLYFANCAVSDFKNKSFHFFERLNRQGPGLAGAREDRLEVWNENWKLIEGEKGFHVEVMEQKTGFDLKLVPQKNPVIHGNGADKPKWEIPQNAPNYFSYTRLKTTGTISVGGRKVKVSGTSWMDRVFGKQLLVPKQKGWDRFLLHLDNGSDLLLFFIRNQDGRFDPRSGGTLIDSRHQSRHIAFEQVQMKALGDWTSETSNITYPSGWRIKLPDENIDIEITPTMQNQELHLLRSLSNAHWAGGVEVQGRYGDKSVKGRGHVELVGYGSGLEQVFPE